MMDERRIGKIGADAAPNEASIVIGNSTPGANIEDFEEHDLILVPRTGELLQVKAVDVPCSTLRVTRALGSTDAQPIDAGDEALIIGRVEHEGG